MSKLPRDVSHRRLVRFLLRHGFHVEREGGKHTVLRRGDDELAVPRHARLRPGLVLHVLKTAAIPRQAWKDL